MPETPSFDDFMARLAQGDQDAAAAVYSRFRPQLLKLVRARITREVRAKVDPEDVVQSAFGSFFWRQADGQYPGLESWDDLWRLLLTITEHKCAARWKYFRAGRRAVEREVSPGDARPRPCPSVGAGGPGAPARTGGADGRPGRVPGPQEQRTQSPHHHVL